MDPGKPKRRVWEGRCLLPKHATVQLPAMIIERALTTVRRKRSHRSHALCLLIPNGKSERGRGCGEQ